jgi:Ca-activated chloride channel family protein
MLRGPDYYALLGLLRTATQDDVRRAYLKAAQKLHPDKNMRPGETQLFLEVQQAYEILSDPKKRAEFDATLPPEQEIPNAVKTHILFSRNALLPNQEQQLVYALMEFSQAIELQQASSPPLNLCLALDCSTSMQGMKMDVVKSTAMQLMKRMRPQDVFSVVTFNDRAEVLLQAARGMDVQKAQVRIQMLQTGGGTEILHGLSAALDQTQRFLEPGNVNHIILLTDGRTYGDEPACLELAQTAGELGIGISGLGIGSEWNDAFLDEIARRTGGSCMYVEDPKDIERLLNEKFTHLSQIFAEESTLEFEPVSDVHLNYAYRLQPEPGPLPIETPLRMGPILRDAHLMVLMEFRVMAPAVRAKVASLLKGQINFSIASLKSPPPPLRVDLVRVVIDQPNAESPPPQIIHALSRLTLYRMQEKARQDVAGGRYEQASANLQRMATHLLAAGQRQLARTVLIEAESLQREGTFTKSGAKLIKFGTRALMLPGEKVK